MQTAVHFSPGRARLIFGVAEYDREQSKKPWYNCQACSVGTFYAASFSWIWSETKRFSRPFSLGITLFFPVPVPLTSEGTDLKTHPLMVPPWHSSMDNVFPGVLCSHPLNGHQRCFASVSGRRREDSGHRAAVVSTPVSTAAEKNMWKGYANECPGGHVEGNIRQHSSPPELHRVVSQPLTSPHLFPPLASYLSHVFTPRSDPLRCHGNRYLFHLHVGCFHCFCNTTACEERLRAGEEESKMKPNLAHHVTACLQILEPDMVQERTSQGMNGPLLLINPQTVNLKMEIHMKGFIWVH